MTVPLAAEVECRVTGSNVVEGTEARLGSIVPGSNVGSSVARGVVSPSRVIQTPSRQSAVPQHGTVLPLQAPQNSWA